MAERAGQGLWSRLSAGFRHAFSLEPETPELSDDDRALLDRIAEGVKRRGLIEPAIFALESLKPLSFLGSQALHAVRPIAAATIGARHLERLARILERRDGVEELVKRIEALA